MFLLHPLAVLFPKSKQYLLPVHSSQESLHMQTSAYYKCMKISFTLEILCFHLHYNL